MSLVKNLQPRMPRPSERNPFKPGNLLFTQFDVMLKAYADKHPDVFHANGRRCIGNSQAGAFWKGYDLNPPYLIQKGSLAYACYRAGQTQRIKDNGAAFDLALKEQAKQRGLV